METQISPPSLEDLTKALRPIVSRGLPVSAKFDDPILLGLRGVVARSIDRDDRLARVKALDELLARVLLHYPDDNVGESARILFGMAPGIRGRNLTARRQAAAGYIGYDPDHFRRRIEPSIIEMVAWQLHRDSQNYIPRGTGAPPPLESSGDTPVIRVGDIANQDASEHEEQVSRLWANVYLLRAEILRAERLKILPYDATEPETSARRLQAATSARDEQVRAVRIGIQRYIDAYGERIEHGGSEFSAESLLRLAGWQQS